MIKFEIIAQLTNAEEIAHAFSAELTPRGIRVATGHRDTVFIVFPDVPDFQHLNNNEICQTFYILVFDHLKLTMTTTINVQFRIGERIVAQMQFFPKEHKARA